ncbi:phosphate acetyltransferase [Brachyspira hampsonii]|uniref:Phosphate acetyltransferase n=1 Tax=Brachyspira hampsonii TaxID=1287055 RepID=A0A1E5NC13_9SPIR|nr:phosphate acetyltransferase [Brachyspira hampsonii]OEJ13617.1 phosphate acetyltransferase [Brachyspira hampsonii]
MASFMDNLKEKAKSNPKTIILAEGYDERHVKAAVILEKEQLVKGLILVGDTAKIQSLAKENSLKLDDGFVRIFDPAKEAKTEQYIEMLFKAREKKGMTKDHAKDLITNHSIYAAAAMIADDDADGMVGGAVYSTGEMLRAALFLIGLKKGIRTLSSTFFLESPDKSLFTNGISCFADCAVIPEPTPEQLADIAKATAESYRIMTGNEPKVALLSFSTKGSAEHESITRVREAKKILDSQDVDFVYDGEMQLDAAMIERVAAQKAPGSPIKGDANVFIFPELNSGNIGHKIAQRVGKCTAIGPMLQGIAKPANDLSRGCSAQDIADLAVITSLQAK